jgi:phasin family protein
LLPRRDRAGIQNKTIIADRPRRLRNRCNADAIRFGDAPRTSGQCSMRAVFTQRNCKMSNVEQIQQAAKDQGDAAMASAHTLATSIQTIASAHADYAKKAMQEGSEFISKLTSLKEPTKVMELQSEYVKNTYETFVAESKKISELYTDLFKQTTKPLEALIAKKNAA